MLMEAIRQQNSGCSGILRFILALMAGAEEDKGAVLRAKKLAGW
jgi:hypothetical protein